MRLNHQDAKEINQDLQPVSAPKQRQDGTQKPKSGKQGAGKGEQRGRGQMERTFCTV
jgi:hypothetical protein